MTDMRDSRNWGFETKQVHVGPGAAGSGHRGPGRAHLRIRRRLCFQDCRRRGGAGSALKAAGNIYGRLTNPTEEVFEQQDRGAGGGEQAALATASGAAAIAYTFQALAKGRGDTSWPPGPSTGAPGTCWPIRFL